MRSNSFAPFTCRKPYLIILWFLVNFSIFKLPFDAPGGLVAVEDEASKQGWFVSGIFYLYDMMQEK